MYEITGKTIPQTRTMLKAMSEQWQSNSETHQINNFETMDITFVMLGVSWVKGWTPLKGTWL